MVDWAAFPMIRQCYHRAFRALPDPAFEAWLQSGVASAQGAALGYRRAGAEPLFLERYLDAPVEVLASAALGREIRRDAIVEIGNFAAANAFAMIQLWGETANDLGAGSEVAAATLTAPLRSMFARVGVPLQVIAPALADRVAGEGGQWGRYYELDPQVCVGEIVAGQNAIAAFFARRGQRTAA